MTKFMVMVVLALGLGACGSDPGSRASLVARSVPALAR